MEPTEKKEFIEGYVKALRGKNAALFAGAGLSASAGYVNWRDLMRGIAEELELDVDKETDLIALAQYHINERLGNRARINQLVLEQFTKSARITENHKILAALPINTYWTTNYDNLIEQALENAGKTPDVKIVSENIVVVRPQRDAIIYKMHGDTALPEKAVITKEDYETYSLYRSPFSIVLQGDLFSKTFLFLGFSFEDPNLSHVLTRIKNLMGKNTGSHYSFFKSEKKPDLIKKQEFKLKDLHRYGIKGILVDDYTEITELLKDVQALYKCSHVFISGAAEVFDEFAPYDSSKEFIHKISKAIVANNFKIISGFGYNVGSGVINGALEHIFSTKHRRLDEYLTLMPFPQFESGEVGSLSEEERRVMKKERNAKYRDEMLTDAGVAIFLFGNKRDTLNVNGPPRRSTGMREEFEIAHKRGIKLVPIGATGYAAKELSEEVLNNFRRYYGEKHLHLKPLIEKLADRGTGQQTLIETTVRVIQELNKI